MSINKVFLTGNLTRDIEVKYTASGMPVGNFGIAVNDYIKNRDGGYKDYANFFELTLFGNRAESLEQYLKKGTKVAIVGKLHFSQWERDGEKRNKVEVHVNEIEFLSRNSNRNDSGISDSDSDSDYYDEDIPF